MDIDARIERRRRRGSSPQLIQDYETLLPVVHINEPSGRGPVFEELLDHLDPVFDGRLPPNAYVCGPPGSGKSAIVTALFSRLSRLPTETQSVIHTSTRAATPISPEFVYVDRRETTSEFAFYHDVLDGLIDESVPEHGVSTDDLRSRLHDRLDDSLAGVVVAIDHVDESNASNRLIDLLAGLPSKVSWIAIGRSDPEEAAVSAYTATTIRITAHQRQMLVDVLMTRASEGLAQQALDHDLARRIAEWADGDAHDALTALFIAADRAQGANADRITESDIEAAIETVPRPCVSLARVLTLPANKQLVLRQLVDLDPEDRATVTATTEAISSTDTVDLSTGTVKRFLYEMAEDGIVERVESDVHEGKGRPPSRIELRFPPSAFRRLYDLRR
ncbi:MAG: Cdc6/Cdc18 family protein [Halobacteriales archaeon]